MDKKKIKELEEVELKRDMEKYGLKKGQRGIIVVVHNNREIEFGCSGAKNMLVKVPVSFVR